MSVLKMMPDGDIFDAASLDELYCLFNGAMLVADVDWEKDKEGVTSLWAGNAAPGYCLPSLFENEAIAAAVCKELDKGYEVWKVCALPPEVKSEVVKTAEKHYEREMLEEIKRNEENKEFNKILEKAWSEGKSVYLRDGQWHVEDSKYSE